MSAFSRIVTLSIVVLCLSMNALAEVNVYSARKENLIKPLLDQFSKETGIKVNLITAKADALLIRMLNEGRNTPADVLITTDAGRLYRAKQAGLLQPIDSQFVFNAVPKHLRDIDHLWVGLSQRARVILYAKDRVSPTQLSSYENLVDDQWRQRICIRSSANIYNQSMVASMIATQGKTATLAWARGLVKNLARKPSGGDRDQIKAAAAGQCDIAIANTYYYANMLHHKKNKSQIEAAEKMAIFWPNQEDRGVHINISGVAISKYSENKAAAIDLIEFLLSTKSQTWYSNVNYEYPAVPGVAIHPLLQSWGAFTSDSLNLTKLGELNAEAVKIMDQAGWQ